MSEFAKVADAQDLKPGESLCVEFGGEKVAVFNVEGKFYAISDACTHVGGPLSMGYVEGTAVTCPLHGATFDLTTGNPIGAPMGPAVKCYQVRAEGGEIRLRMP
jgi:3-phenylpropionate/trans-cinnamate dioxygenase ferredoxin subunit